MKEKSSGSMSPKGRSPSFGARKPSMKLVDALSKASPQRADSGSNLASPATAKKLPSKLELSRRKSKGGSNRSLDLGSKQAKGTEDSPLRLNMVASSEGLQLNR